MLFRSNVNIVNCKLFQNTIFGGIQFSAYVTSTAVTTWFVFEQHKSTLCAPCQIYNKIISVLFHSHFPTMYVTWKNAFYSATFSIHHNFCVNHAFVSNDPWTTALYIWALFMDKGIETRMDEHSRKKRTIANFMHYTVHTAHTHTRGIWKKVKKSIDIRMSCKWRRNDSSCLFHGGTTKRACEKRWAMRILLIRLIFTNFNIILFMFFFLFIFDRFIFLFLRIFYSVEL